MLYSRRDIGRMALAVLPAAHIASRASGASGRAATRDQAASKPNSKWAGVQVGLNMPYSFDPTNHMSGDDVLAHCLQLGVSALELRSQPVEAFMGAPIAPLPVAGTPQAKQQADQKEFAVRLNQWRLSAPMSQAQAFRRHYESAGVAIDIVKYDNILTFSDAVLDYSFALAAALGAKAISCELPPAQVEDSRRLGQFADKHKLMVGYHGHTLMTPALWEQAFTYAAHNGANLDLGHFVSGQQTSPIPFLTKHHDRITHIHVKDKTLGDKNVPFGQGDTPVREALRLIRDRKWNIQATIEFEYPVPAGSDRMTEIAKCVAFCKEALLTEK